MEQGMGGTSVSSDQRGKDWPRELEPQRGGATAGDAAQSKVLEGTLWPLHPSHTKLFQDSC